MVFFFTVQYFSNLHDQRLVCSIPALKMETYVNEIMNGFLLQRTSKATNYTVFCFMILVALLAAKNIIERQAY